MRRATEFAPFRHRLGLFQSTLSVRRATHLLQAQGLDYAISIHALREESDVLDSTEFGAFGIISIHALREESDSIEPVDEENK